MGRDGRYRLSWLLSRAIQTVLHKILYGGTFPMTSKERHEARYQRRRAKREARRAAVNAKCTFEQVFSFSHLYQSYRKCCLGVGWKSSTQIYRANALLNVAKTHEALQNGTFRSKGFNEFNIFERGKPRHIRAVHISERVVQRCLCDYALISLLERSFIYDNGASTKGKGISFALNRLETHLHKFWCTHGTCGYVLTFDVHHYFDSIPHEHIFRIIDRAITDERLKQLTKYFVSAFGKVGMGLGSQVSQVFALAALNGLDHRIKEQAGIKYYGRYMDDGYLIHHDKAYLEKCRRSIIRYCRSIGLELNENKTQIRPISRGIPFLKVKFSVSETGRVIRRPSRKNTTSMRRKLKTFRRWLDDPKKRFTFEDVRTSYMSWIGHIKQSDSWRTRQRMDLLYQDLFAKELKTCTAS